MRYIILTVPHATCSNEFARDCDERAFEAAVVMKYYLEYFINIKHLSATTKVLIFPNLKVLREICDMNRPSCRKTKYRKSLRHLIKSIQKEKQNEIIFLLDMHSFPNYDSWKSNNIERRKNYKLVFLYIDDSPFNEVGFFKKCLLGARNIGFLQGSMLNDIMVQAQEKDIPSILIESHEDDEIYTTAEMEIHFKRIADCITNL